MDETKKMKRSTLIIILLSAIIVILLGYILVDKLIIEKEDTKVNDNSTPTTSTTTNPTTSTTASTTTSTTTKAIVNDSLTARELISKLKDYSKVNNLCDASNIKEWNITNVTYFGYYKNKVDEKIYILSGKYTCKDQSSDCVYMEQDIDDNSYKGVIKLKDKNIIEMLPPTFDAQVKVLEKDDFVVIEQKIE